jgi:carbonic anhydrase/acetyltransferase-like protein (isoleucine patch superfamily)
MAYQSARMQGGVMIIAFNGKTPKIGDNTFIAPTAVIIGDVEIGDGASIWYGAVLRGDVGPIRVGADTSIQDNSTVHSDHGVPTTIGAEVTVAHNAVIHGCTIEDNCLIGNGALVLNAAIVRRGSMVGAGAVVREGQEVGPGHLVAGVPARLKRSLTEEEKALLRHATEMYKFLSGQYAALSQGPQ